MPDKNEPLPPCVIPPLDRDFRPAALAHRAFQKDTESIGVPLVLALERENGLTSRFETRIYPEHHTNADQNFAYAERIARFLFWQRGGWRLRVGGPASLAVRLREAFSLSGAGAFESSFIARQVYEHPLEIISCEAADIPPGNDVGRDIGRHLEGCRIGFDLGASDRKVSAVRDGSVVFSEEVIWEPKKQSDPGYHYREITAALNSAAAHLPRVDAIGGSAAGIYINNRPMVASLFRAVPPERVPEVRALFQRIRDEWRVPLEVINDGDVTALAGSMSLGVNGVLGLAMGSGEAAGYVDSNGRVLGWLNELGFAQIDIRPEAPKHDWSGATGCGSQYLSQQAVFRLAPRAGIALPGCCSDAERLRFVQEKLEAGHAGAADIWRTLGVYLGYALGLYASFYDMEHVLILGRCTSGKGGAVILESACEVLAMEFPDFVRRFQLHLPDEKSRRVGQAVAAAGLPSRP
jgi:predicted NBD/HSP70 family sugar kinase